MGSRRARARAALVVIAVMVGAACGGRRGPVVPETPPAVVPEIVPPPEVLPESMPAPPTVAIGARAMIRVALSGASARPRLSATGPWRLYDRAGASMVLRAGGGDAWTIEREGDRLRGVSDDGEYTVLREGPFVARPGADGVLLTVDDKRYRGELWLHANSAGIITVNRLGIEEYLLGVVPLEIGPRTPAEAAAVEAQAVAARSYAYVRLPGDPSRPFDLVSTVNDQVYGGAEAESPVADVAVHATTGLVLLYGGRVVNAPYYSTCGGQTAEASEVWRSGDEPYLRRVSDRIPGTDRFYCDIAPRFAWTRRYSARELDRVLARYLRQVVGRGARGTVGTARQLDVQSRTPSGRVGRLAVETDRGRWVLRGNDIRFVLRSSAGEILNSTYFSVEPDYVGGRLAAVTLRGRGYGHGIGMCQWGAIGRARAGQDFRTILQTYYPGTTVGTLE